MWSQQPARALFAVGLLGLGILALVVGDFAMVWQPVPEFPGRTAVAYAAGVLMVLLGVGLAFRATTKWAVRVLFLYLITWALLKVPAIVVAPQIEGVWLGLGELTALLAGGWTLFARLGEIPEGSPLAFLAGDRGVRAARILFAVSIVPIGLSHILYVKETVALIPPYFPVKPFWAYLTGAGQMASGLGLLFGVLPRVAAWAEVTQLSLYLLLVWLPPTVTSPKTRLNWTAFFITWVVYAAAWAVAQNYCSHAPAGRRAPNWNRDGDPEPVK